MIKFKQYLLENNNHEKDVIYGFIIEESDFITPNTNDFWTWKEFKKSKFSPLILNKSDQQFIPSVANKIETLKKIHPLLMTTETSKDKVFIYVKPNWKTLLYVQDVFIIGKFLVEEKIKDIQRIINVKNLWFIEKDENYVCCGIKSITFPIKTKDQIEFIKNNAKESLRFKDLWTDETKKHCSHVEFGNKFGAFDDD